MRISRRLILTVAVLAAPLALADEVILKSGGRVSGRIVSRTDKAVEVDVGAGLITVQMSSVVRIEERRSALDEYADRAARIPAGDVEAWVALGEWATGQGLSSQAREAYHRALAAAPNDPRANAGVGNVEVNGRWASEDEAYRAKGYVKFDGQWMSPSERDAIERERAADSQRAHQQLQDQQRVREAEDRAQEAEARAKKAEADAQQASEGLPLWYAWGGGPTYWPSRPVVAPPRPRPR